MDEPASTTTKRTTRARKTTTAPVEETATVSPISKTVIEPNIVSLFIELNNRLSQSRSEYEVLQKQIQETRLEWEKQQKEYKATLVAERTQQELDRKREQESYQYELNRKRKLAEDEFNDKKSAWEKQLRDNQEQMKQDRDELEELRKLVAGFEADKTVAVKLAVEQISQELSKQFEFDKKISGQEFRSEKEVLGIKISNLTGENTRQAKEIEQLKKSFDEATDQVKEIAVKVIESRKPTPALAQSESSH